ncbi:MAG: hypothetical protein IJ686_01770 [Bacteroidales bacterium]|nr:hypothetical protein [Bacteroidales bacterium]
MAPCVRGGVMSLKLTPFNKFSLGMIVLAESNCGLVLHRIMDIDGESIMLMADASTFAQEYCKAEDIIGVGVEMQNILTGRTKRISTAFLWRKLLPFRQYLLRLYDLFHPDQPVPYL